MERIKATECILNELEKFDQRCKRREHLQNNDNLTNYPLISDVVEYFFNLDYAPLFGGEIDEETIYKSYVTVREDVDKSVEAEESDQLPRKVPRYIVINFNATSTFGDANYTFAKMTIKQDETSIEIVRPWMANFENLDDECFGKSKITISNGKITKEILYRDENGRKVYDYKYAFYSQSNEPYYFGFGRAIDDIKQYEAGLDSLKVNYEDRIMFKFRSEDKLKPYSRVKGDFVGAIYDSNPVDTVEKIYVSLKTETELRIEHAKLKEAKRTRKAKHEKNVED